MKPSGSLPVKSAACMNLIASVDRNWGIGCKNSLLVRIKEDMRFFKEMTAGKIVVMGRKTRESIPGGILKGRVNIILSGSMDYKVQGAVVVHSRKELWQELRQYDPKDVFVIGGESLYRQLLDACGAAYITKIAAAFPADAYFPNLDRRPEWHLAAESEEKVCSGIRFRFQRYEKETAGRKET